MPVTKTATRALRVSNRKTLVNKKVKKELEVALRTAKKSKKVNDVNKAVSLIDRAVKKFVLHKNKAARMKSALTKNESTQKPPVKKAVKKNKK